MIELVLFYKWQILIALVLSALVSSLGVFVLLRRMVFFSLTLSQAASLGMMIGLFMGSESPLFASILCILLMLPFYWQRERRTTYPDAMYGFALVTFVALSHILTVISGKLRIHSGDHFFGDILLADDSELLVTIGVPLVLLGIFVYLLNYFTTVFFDRDQAKISGYPVRWIDFIFFLLLGVTVTYSIFQTGSFLTLAWLVLPALAGAGKFRSILSFTLFSAMFSVALTMAGFFLSFLPLPGMVEEVHLPTSSVLILTLGLGNLAMAIYGLVILWINGTGRRLERHPGEREWNGP